MSMQRFVNQNFKLENRIISIEKVNKKKAETSVERSRKKQRSAKKQTSAPVLPQFVDQSVHYIFKF